MLETRLLIAYSIIAALAVTGTVALVMWKRRRDARRLRLRGIKTAERAAERTVARNADRNGDRRIA